MYIKVFLQRLQWWMTEKHRGYTTTPCGGWSRSILQKSSLGGDPPEGYPPRGMWLEDVACEDDVVQNISRDTEGDHKGIDMEAVNLRQRAICTFHKV